MYFTQSRVSLITFKFLYFRSGAVVVFLPQGYVDASLDDWYLTFRGNILVSSSRFGWGLELSATNQWEYLTSQHSHSEISFSIQTFLKLILRFIVGFEPLRSRCTWALQKAVCAPQSDTRSRETCHFTKVPDGPRAQIPNILWDHEKGAQICTSECSEGLTLT